MFSHDYYEIREISIKDQAGTSCAGTDANKAVSTLITALWFFVFYVLRKEIEFCLLRASSDLLD